MLYSYLVFVRGMPHVLFKLWPCKRFAEDQLYVLVALSVRCDRNGDLDILEEAEGKRLFAICNEIL